MKRHTKEYLSAMLSILVILTHSSCTDMFDSLKEFATEETIYPASFDTVAGKIGFERVEIDFSRNGRIPSSQMKLAKAKKTVIECAYFDEPLVIDSVCSWVNITGLSEPGEYTFKIYTEDEDGNRSVPKEISLVPYTSEDLEQMELLSPKITTSSAAALIEWERKLSGVSFDCLGYSYAYSDKDGAVQTGDESGDVPSFIIENITKGSATDVRLTLRIVPKKNDVFILDTIDWVSHVPITIPESAGEVIFLKAPASAYTIDLNTSETSSYSFSWTEVEGIESYTLKVSTNSNFASGNTFELNVGNVSSVDLSAAQVAGIVKEGSANCYWTVVPSSGNAAVTTQTRGLNIYRSLILSGMWLFEDVSDLFGATIGQPLIGVSLDGGNPIRPVAGQHANDKAIFVPQLSYLTCRHGIQPGIGENYVNEYTVAMNINLSDFRWFSIADINESNNNGELFISPNGELSLNGWWNSASANMTRGTWHHVVYSVNLEKAIKIYLDGKLIKAISADASWKDGDYALRSELQLFKDDNGWNDVNDAHVSGITVWGSALNDLEVAQLGERNMR
ncbi:DUF4998 domain-containing protein [Parapedobacter sp.]|uniref:DUF4998 domain-containing protein n=1 Tax=Parapedobacter sp. TaxID=1958893 RepID=UPI002D805263|nr:DUF4998 domain-containing protein [Parapedobacter sp.]